MTRAERVLEGEVLAPESDEQRAVRERLKFLAWLLDSSIPIPGTPYRIGLDAIVGLLPFIGDLIGVVGRTILARMACNVALEGVIGIVPLLGDLFDAAWKANTARQPLIPRAAHARPDRPRGAQRRAAVSAVRRALRLGCA